MWDFGCLASLVGMAAQVVAASDASTHHASVHRTYVQHGVVAPPLLHHGHRGGGGGHSGGGGPGVEDTGGGGGGGTVTLPGLGAVGGGGFFWGGAPPYFVSIGPDGRPFLLGPPVYMMNPGVPVPLIAGGGGPLAGPMPLVAARKPRPIAPVKRADGAKRTQLVIIGDRQFRAGNLKRSEERYQQAAKADPDAAEPMVRLAQVALRRGRFAEAADLVRDAIAREPGWLAKAPPIQTLYGEPWEFHKSVAKLESHVLAEPADRDAWLVLGAQLYLSGQTRRAADVFLRLTDRKPDAALAALLDASRARPAED